MTAGKRMALAFGCVLLGVGTLGAWALLGALLTMLLGRAPHPGLRDFSYLVPLLQMLVVYLLFAIPGWVLALPFVLLFRDANGRRFWLILLIGSAIGPVFMLSWALISSHGHLVWKGNDIVVVLSLWIGFFTSFFYALLLRRFTRGHERRAMPAGALAD